MRIACDPSWGLLSSRKMPTSPWPDRQPLHHGTPPLRPIGPRCPLISRPHAWVLGVGVSGFGWLFYGHSVTQPAHAKHLHANKLRTRAPTSRRAQGGPPKRPYDLVFMSA